MSKSSLLINIKSLLLSLFAALFIGTAANAQSLIHLSDATGISISASEEAELQRAADSLIVAFPVAFQDSFKVYDCGFYLQQEHYQGGYPEVFGKLVEEAGAQSKYYLVVGKSISPDDEQIKYYCNVHFPNTNIFTCIDLFSDTKRIEYNNIVNMLANEAKSPAEAINIAILKTKNIVKSLGCCSFNFMGNTQCNSCVYDAEYFCNFFGKNYFVSVPVRIVSDPNWVDLDLETFQGDGNLGETRSVTLNCRAKETDVGEEIGLDSLVYNMISEYKADIQSRFGSDVEIEVFKFKYPRDCQNFETVWNEYEASTAQIKSFFGLINVNNNIGVLGFHTTTNSLFPDEGENSRLGSSNSHAVKSGEQSDSQEAKAQLTNLCLNVASSAFTLGSNYIALSSDKLHISEADFARIRASIELDTKKLASDNAVLSPYLSKEGVILWRSFYSTSDCWAFCEWRCKYTATLNVCGDAIHSVLDICGLIPNPVGIACDLTNGIVYLTEGSFKDAVLSSIGYVGDVSKIVKNAKWYNSFSAFSSGSKIFDANSKAVRLYRNIKGKSYFGSRARLLKYAKKFPDTEFIVGNNVYKYLGDGTQELHHIIPWELVSGENTNSTIAAIREIWHPNDLLENGFPIWKKVKSQTNNFVTGTFETIEGEIVFHGYHPEYTKYVKKELNKIKGDPLAMKKAVQELTINLKKKIVEAYDSGISLNQAAIGW